MAAHEKYIAGRIIIRDSSSSRCIRGSLSIGLRSFSKLLINLVLQIILSV